MAHPGENEAQSDPWGLNPGAAASADPYGDPLAGGDPFAPFGEPAPVDPNALPPDNEHGDGVRPPIDYKTVPGIKGFGGWTKSHEHKVYAENARDAGEIWPGMEIR